MPQYMVTLEQKRFETVQVEIEACSAEEAEEKALAKADELKWQPDDVDKESRFASEVEELA